MASEVEVLKNKGNQFMKEEKYDEAVKMYTEAIEIDSQNHVLFSNRSAAYCKKDQFAKALEDAEKTIDIKSDWPKGYSRKGAALFQLGKLEEAESAFKEGLMKDPANAMLKSGLEDVKAKRAEMANPFRDPKAEQKLRSNPKTKDYLDDPQFRMKFQLLQQDAKNLMSLMNDQKIVDAVGALLGVELSTMGGGGGGMGGFDPMVHRDGRGPSSADLTGEGKEEPMETEPEEPPESEVPAEDKEREQKALAEKEKGNEAYKKKDFPTAIAHYDRAFEIDPTNILFLTNKAAVYFEMQRWDDCIKLCEEAVERGRELRADFKAIAKALGRMGSVYAKTEEYALAVKYFDKSLAESRNQDIIKKKKEAETKLKEKEKKAYINPEKSLEEKEKGNKLFKDGKFPEAIKYYNEAIKRNPEDPILYSNRAACYQKLLEFPLALKDCEQCLELDPKYLKGHIRKGHALVAMKDLVKARQAFQAALDIDPSNVEAKNGVSRCIGSDDPEARRKAAMHDPEVQTILNDPAMQMILQQMQSQPEALRDHLKNPDIAAKIQKLIECGFISLR